jgi:uncharacterized protein YecE (DUF72 family)
MIRVGTAGWDYNDWAGIVYPAPKPKGFDPLRYLSRYLDTIEVNSTFYRPAAATSAHSWVARVDENADFRFTAKLWKRFTHERETAWTPEEVDAVREAFDPMAEAGKLGAVLVQFPWSFRSTDENEEWLRDVIGAFKEYPLVVEVRHDSWLSAAFLRELYEAGVGFVNIDQPQFADSVGPTAIATGPVGYVRVHGRNYHDWWRKDAGVEARYDYLYSADELRPWVERTEEIAQAPETENVFVVTNNHYHGQAVANALMAKSMLSGGESKPAAPPSLVETYPKALEGRVTPVALAG